jgi:predicted ATPase
LLFEKTKLKTGKEMPIQFYVIQRGKPKQAVTNQAVGYLEKDDWDDYSFRTSFDLTIFDAEGRRFDLGHVKIGYKGQAVPEVRSATYTASYLPPFFETLDDIFSVGQDVEYYKKLLTIAVELRVEILKGLKDVAFDLNILNDVCNEEVFISSLRRDEADPIKEVKTKFREILGGASVRTPFNFKYKIKNVELQFDTEVNDSPPSNIHVLIGRNGAGKTTLLNSMASCYLNSNYEGYRTIGTDYGGFYTKDIFNDTPVSKDYFFSVVFVSFSAFDSFEYPEEYVNALQEGDVEGDTFSYIGLKTKKSLIKNSEQTLKNKSALNDEFIKSLQECFRFGHTKGLWLDAILLLHSDDNFSEMGLNLLTELDDSKLLVEASKKFLSMSSGHSIVLLTLTKLINKVKEKSLVLIDEPEGHLHPPLLSAFLHSLSDLLIYRNGLAIIATHSPVVLQEVPKDCVWNIIRYGENISPQRLDIETYGENVGLLTREVFQLEVKESGFHRKLKDLVSKGHSYDQILNFHHGALGLEGRSTLRSLIYKRDNGSNKL